MEFCGELMSVKNSFNPFDLSFYEKLIPFELFNVRDLWMRRKPRWKGNQKKKNVLKQIKLFQFINFWFWVGEKENHAPANFSWLWVISRDFFLDPFIDFWFELN